MSTTEPHGDTFARPATESELLAAILREMQAIRAELASLRGIVTDVSGTALRVAICE